MSEKILAVEDNVDMRRIIDAMLAKAGYEAILAPTAEEGLRLAVTESPDLVLLDVKLPGMGGYEMCQKLREVSQVPVIFLTAMQQGEHVIRGLEAGADDYVIKPFEQSILLARIKAHLRRAAMTRPDDRLIFADGELIIDTPSRQVTVRDEVVSLTPREYDLLVTLAQNEGCVMTPKELVRLAWDWNFEAHDPAYNVKPYIHYLRRKIEANPSRPRWIQTARGVGYRFVDAE